MKAQELLHSILKLAMEGKLVPQVKSEKCYSNLNVKSSPTISEKNNDDFDFFEIPNKWRWEKIKNVVILTENLNIHSQLDPDTIINYVDINSIDNKKYCINYNDIKIEKVRNLSSRARRVLKKDQIIYSLVRPYLNNIAVIEENKENFIGSTGLVVFKTDINTKFFFYYLLSPQIRKYYLYLMKGFNSPSVTQKQFLNTYIPIPPLEEQKRIVDKIEELLPYVEEYGGAQDKLEELNETFPEKIKTSILQEGAQGNLVPQNPDAVPAKELLAQIHKEKERLIKDKKIKRNSKESVIFRDNGHFYEKVGKKGEPVCIDDEIPFEIPDTWEWARLNTIGFLQTGTTPPTKNPEYYGNDIPFIKPADISFNEINYKNEGLSNLGKTKGRLIKKSSVLMVCIGGSRGKCCFNTQDVCCNQQINTVTPFLINYKFLFYILCSTYFQKLVFKESTGTATPIVNKTTWGSFIMPLPPLEEQKRIVEKIDELLPLLKNMVNLKKN